MIERIKNEQSNLRLFILYIRDLEIKDFDYKQLEKVVELQQSANDFLSKLNAVEDILKPKPLTNDTCTIA